jgi:hypothetical protein
VTVLLIFVAAVVLTFSGQALVVFLFMVALGAMFWQGLLSRSSSKTGLPKGSGSARGSDTSFTFIKAVPLGALTVFAVTIPVSLVRAIVVSGGLTNSQSLYLALITLTLLTGLAYWKAGPNLSLRLASPTDVVPVCAAFLITSAGLITTFANRVTALAIFMGGGDHANHVGRAVSILNAGAAGSTERLSYLRPGGLNPLHFLAAELFSVQGGSAKFIDAPDFYMFFYRFEWIQIGIWVLATGLVSQVAFLMMSSKVKLKPVAAKWAMGSAALTGVALLALPFVSSVSLLGFSTSLTVAWLVLAVPTVFLSLGRSRGSLKILFLASVLTALVVVSIRTANLPQVLLFPLLMLIYWIRGYRKLQANWRSLAVLILASVVIIAFGRVVGPYALTFLSAGNPSGTSEEPSFWILTAMLLSILLGYWSRSKSQDQIWFWSWLWAGVFGLLAFLTFMVLRFGSPPNDPDYLASKTIFSIVAFILPIFAGLLAALVVVFIRNVKSIAFKTSMMILPLATLLFMNLDQAWRQAFDAWRGQGHPMTWFSAPFAAGLSENSYPVSLKNRDASWLAALSFEAYSQPTLPYDVLIRPDPVFGAWYEEDICKFIEKNQIKVMVTDGFELQGALTDCPAAAGVSYVVPPRLVK